MKKVIFISALAIAAAVSCTKSDIVDTKFNEAISFETYTGRDAMTKATPYGSAALPADLGLYGYYLGNRTEWGTELTANLWKNAELTKEGNWAPTDKKYWANATDNYTFLAYAPYTNNAEGSILTVAETAADKTGGENPVLTYSVPTTLANQIDLLYSNNNALIQKPDNGAVNINFQHALARLTVKAKEKAKTDFQFYVKEVKVSGNFYVSGQFNLYDGDWVDGKYGTKTGGETYSFYNEPDNKTPLTTTSVDYSGTETVEGETKYGTNYLMMIPTTEDVTLYVKYATFYQGQESKPIEKKLVINQDFVMGNAYAIELSFEHITQEITFTVTCENWTEVTPDITGGNPNGGTPWTPANAQ